MLTRRELLEVAGVGAAALVLPRSRAHAATRSMQARLPNMWTRCRSQACSHPRPREAAITGWRYRNSHKSSTGTSQNDRMGV
jgi:hypothetical protein